MIRLADGRVLDGTPIQIVRSMLSLAQVPAGTTIREYVDAVVFWSSNAGHTVDVDHSLETDEELAESLLNALISAGLAFPIN